MTGKLILDLCGGSGSWSKPYRDAGYWVIVVDPHATVPGTVRQDVRLFRPPSVVPVHGILAAPPCTDFCKAGARWWSQKEEQALLDALSIVDACLRMVTLTRPKWWVLENPNGRLTDYLGPPAMTFDPWQYGDGYRKSTHLWGRFIRPTPGSA